MNKPGRNRTLIIVLVLALLGFIYVAVIAPKPVNWSLSYSAKHDIPLGEKLVYNFLPVLFPGERIITMHSRLEEFLEGTIPFNTNFIYITDQFLPDILEQKKIFEVIEAGNNVFVAAGRLSDSLQHELKIEIRRSVKQDNIITTDSISMNFTNRKIKTAWGYWYKNAISDNYFMKYDSAKTTVLGYNNEGKTNFIRIRVGEGFLYLNSNPLAFTNYQLLTKDHSEYIFKSLSYLPVGPTVWDEFYKPGKSGVVNEITYILKDPSLRIAWYILLFGVFLYFVLKGKRRQRAIPVITLQRNNTLEFVETVGRLYFVNHDHLGIAQKRFIYFLDFLKTKYYVDTSNSDSRLIEDVSRKSGIPERTVTALFRVAANLGKVKYISQEDLQQFNRQIEYFYKNCQ